MANVGVRVSPLPLQATKRQSVGASPRKGLITPAAKQTRRVRTGRKAQVY